MAVSGFSGPWAPENPSRASWALPGPIPDRLARKYSPPRRGPSRQVLDARIFPAGRRDVRGLGEDFRGGAVSAVMRHRGPW